MRNRRKDMLILGSAAILTAMAGAAAPGSARAANPCAPAAAPCSAKPNPCAAASPCAANPCAAKANPCDANANPCAAKPNPCGANANPCAAKPNPCGANANPCAAKPNPCGANANPCAAGSNSKSLAAKVTRPSGTALPSGDHAALAAEGQTLFQDTSLSTNGMSCASCHEGGMAYMDTFQQAYPHRVEMAANQAGMDEIALDEMIQLCMVVPMEAEPLGWESRQLAALQAYMQDVQAEVVGTAQ
jgi:hypothetical protein